MCFICVSARLNPADNPNHIPINEGVSIAAFSSGSTNIDALLEDFSWTGTTGQSTTVNYSFGFSAEGGSVFNSTQQTQALKAMAAWSNVTNITFNEVSSGADLTFSQTDLGFGTAGLAVTYFSGTTIASSEVMIDDSITDLSEGSFGYLTLLHEIGHSLGLKHPGNYGSSDVAPFLSSAEDTIQNTVMSYNSSNLVNELSNPSESPMLYDIAAIQYLYGANTGYMTGDTTYSYDGSTEVVTLWDAGGTDTLSASGVAGNVRISLKAGDSDEYSQIGNTLVWIAENTRVERALGGDGNDTVTGDDGANELFGGNGADSLSGGDGNDTLYGGNGIVDTSADADTITGDDGDDLIYGNAGNDFLYGGEGLADAVDGNDTIFGGGGEDFITGNAGDDSLSGGGNRVDPSDAQDTVYGGKGSDIIFGNGGNDVLYGGGSLADPDDQADTIYGGVGDDQLFGNGGNDILYGQDGNDVLHAGFGDDIYVFSGSTIGGDVISFFEGAGSAGGDIIQLESNLLGSGITTAEQAVTALFYNGAGDAFLNFGGTNVITVSDVGINALSADDFQII